MMQTLSAKDLQVAVDAICVDGPVEHTRLALEQLARTFSRLREYAPLARSLSVVRAKFARAGRPELEAACLTEACRLELRRGNFAAALRAGRAAVRLAASLEEGTIPHARARLEMGKVLWKMYRDLEAEREFKRSLELFRAGGRRDLAYGATGMLALARSGRGDLVGPRRVLREVMTAAERAGDLEELGGWVRNLSYLDAFSGDARATWRTTKRAFRLARETGDVPGAWMALGRLGAIAAARGHAGWGERTTRRAVQEVRACRPEGDLALALSFIGAVHLAMGDLEEARAETAEAAALRERQDDPSAASARATEARIAFRCGRLEDARALAEEARATLFALRYLAAGAGGVGASLLLAELYFSLGALERAGTELKHVRSLLRIGRGFLRSEALVDLGLARYERLAGRRARAARLLERAGRVIETLGNGEDRVELDLERAAADPSTRAAALRSAEARARAGGFAWNLAHVLLAKGGARDLAEARDLAARRGFRLVEVEAEEALAARAEAAGRAGEAAERRARAAPIRAACVEGLPSAILAVSGRRPQPAPAPAAAIAPAALPSLTKAEREVLALLGEGLANKEIAKRLFISPQTVRTHLAHIFPKLGVHSRVQAALIARGGG